MGHAQTGRHHGTRLGQTSTSHVAAAVYLALALSVSKHPARCGDVSWKWRDRFSRLEKSRSCGVATAFSRVGTTSGGVILADERAIARTSSTDRRDRFGMILARSAAKTRKFRSSGQVDWIEGGEISIYPPKASILKLSRHKNGSYTTSS